MMKTYHIPQHVIGTEFDQEYILLHSESGYYFELNRVGTVIWKMLVAGDSSQAIIEAVVNRYDMPREVVEEDFWELVEHLIANGILETTD